MPSTLEILEKLISFDTTSKYSNRAMILWIKEYLDAHKIDNGCIEQPGGEDKLNLWARVGTQRKGGIILSGHSDVVPADDLDWQSPPFTMTLKGDRLYGRGTTDMKGFIAVTLSRIVLAEPNNLSRPIWLSISCDEEVGCLGAPYLVEHFLAEKADPYAVIVGEPTSMKTFSSHKSIQCYRTVVKGIPGHSSAPAKGKSAIQAACRMVLYLNDQMVKGQKDPDFNPSYSTLHVGKISGGVAINMIAPECHFEWDMRCIPKDNPQKIFDSFHQWCRQDSFLSGFQVKSELLHNVPTFYAMRESRAEILSRQINGDNGYRSAAYTTEAGQFQAAGFPTTICGPGSIEQAHIVDEFLDINQLKKAEDFIDSLISFCTD